MGGPVGKLGHIGIGAETIFGTAVAAGSYLPFDSETVTLGIEDLLDPSLMARRDEGQSYEGAHTNAGDTVHKVHPAGIGHLLRASLGAPITTDNTGSYTHVYTPLSGRSRDSGTATAGGASTLTDGGKSWTVNEYAGRWVHIFAGTSSGDFRLISSNTATILTVSAAFTSAPDATSRYRVLDGPQYCTLPPYSMEISRDLTGATAAFRYTGMSLNNLAFTVGSGAKILTATASWIGKDHANIEPTTPSLPTTNAWIWDDLNIGIGLATSGTASGGSANTLVHTGASWTVNAYQNAIVYTTGGVGPNQVRKIVSNTADTLTVTPNWTVAAAATTTYKIFYVPGLTETLTWNWNNGLVGVPTLNNSKVIQQIVSDTFRTGGMSPTLIPEDITDFSTYFDGWTTREWLLWFHGANITGNHYYELIIYFPKVRFMAYPINIGGPGRTTVGATCKMKYNTTAAYFCKTILQNNSSSYGV